MKNQTGLGEPTRDWFPISFMSTFSDWADLVHGPNADWGSLSCGCHPNCGVGMARDDRQGNQGSRAGHGIPERRPHREGRREGERRRARTVPVECWAWRWRWAENYDPFKSPKHFRFTDLLKKFDKTFGATKSRPKNVRQG